MKHPLNITIVLILLYLLIELFGMFSIVYLYRTTEIQPISEEDKKSFFHSLIAGFFIITFVILILIYLRYSKITGIWYYTSIFFAFYFTLNIFFNTLISAILSFLLLYLRTTSWRNLTEFFIYPGIVAILIPFLDLNYIVYLLIIFAVYDFISVRITKHMIYLAKGQMKNSLFAGIHIDYNTINTLRNENQQSNLEKSLDVKPETLPNKTQKKLTKKKLMKGNTSAILGGGDIAFPLLLISYLAINYGIVVALFGLIGAVIGLTFIFFRSKNKFYPALPYIVFFMFLSLRIGLSFL